GITLLLLVRPVSLLLMARISERAPAGADWLQIAGYCGLIVIFHAAVVKISMQRGWRALEALEL
ncbi:MAG TPA: hypothetical protein VJ417_14875, partial [Candidatus Glassbacteria bacterium]|nr:hypothetical protein [Candidatus Glassbacteria bacterium]